MMTIKPLDQKDFDIEIIKDLGMQKAKTTSKRTNRYAIFKCISCKNPHRKLVDSAKAGHNQCISCAMTKHGLTTNENHPMYSRWANMRRRCLDKKAHNYKYYGERGITISEEFSDFKIFIEYISSLDGYLDPTLTLDRKDNDGNYERGNLRWATRSEQALNRRKKLAVNT